MNNPKTHACSICGDEEPDARDWFLISENCLEDKLLILHWNDRLAGRLGIHSACSAAHVQELVVHWMTTGSLNYPFALPKSAKSPLRRATGPGRVSPPIPGCRTRPIGELAVDRESMKRVLSDSPHSLRSILDALLRALQEPPSPHGAELEAEGIALATIPWDA